MSRTTFGRLKNEFDTAEENDDLETMKRLSDRVQEMKVSEELKTNYKLRIANMEIIRKSNELKNDEIAILGKFHKKYKEKTLPPESFVVLLILISIFLNIALHKRGLVKHTMTTMPDNRREIFEGYNKYRMVDFESLSADRALKREYLKKKIPNELKTVFPDFILKMNNVINGIIKRAGIIVQPGVLNAVFGIIRGEPLDAVLNGTAMRQIINSGSGTGIYPKMTKALRQVGMDDLSGHGFLGMINIVNSFQTEEDNALKYIWLSAISLNAIITIIYFHTVPEYLAGLVIGGAWQYAINSIVKKGQIISRNYILLNRPEFGTGSGITGKLSRGALGLLNTGNTSIKQKKEGGKKRRKTKRRRKSNKKKRGSNKKKQRKTRGKKIEE